MLATLPLLLLKCVSVQWRFGGHHLHNGDLGVIIFISGCPSLWSDGTAGVLDTRMVFDATELGSVGVACALCCGAHLSSEHTGGIN